MSKFFTKLDWAAFWTATLLTFAVYALTLGPSVGLEDSGELATAAANLGVPHPPGYPFWTFCSWLFCKVFGWVTYMGHPNPAWCVSLCSAFFGALASGCTAMLICRSARDFVGDTSTSTSLLSFGGGVAGALTFALSPVEWSQSTIVEIYSLNAFFLMAVFLLSYRWMAKPSDKILWATAFVFGLGLTNYQVLLFAIVPLALIIALRNLPMFRDFALYLIPVLLALQILQVGDLQRSTFEMQSDVINKHAPVGISDREMSDKLVTDNYYEYFSVCARDPQKWRRMGRTVELRANQALASGDKEVYEDFLYTSRMLAHVDRQFATMTPSVKESLKKGVRHELVAKTSRCPSETGVILALVLLVGSLLSGVWLKPRKGATVALKTVLFGGGAGAALLLLCGVVFVSEKTWSGLTLGDAPLAEPSVYVTIAALIAASVVSAVASTIETEEPLHKELTPKRLLIASGVFAALAVLSVFVFVSSATSVSGFGGLLKYHGEAYPWWKSSLVFLTLLGVFFAVAWTVPNRRGLAYAIPVAGFHLAVFLLLARGAMNGLVHPTTWWFWWPIAWNFVVLALALALLPHGRAVAGAAFFAQLGISFYAYMPIVSDLRNPPMNWGYPRTWEGFKHALTRGQYEAIGFQIPKWGQLVNYFQDVRVQFTDIFIPFALVPFAAGHWIVKKENRRTFWQWMAPAFVCFLMMSVLLIALANVKGDLQDGFIQKVKFIASHAMLALWIGYGLVFAAVFGIQKLSRRSTPIPKIYTYSLAAVMIVVAFVYPLVDNYCGDYCLGVNEVAFKLGGSEQNGHTFGWQFGAYQLEGAKAINEQLTDEEEPLPDPTYPPSMDKFSIFFGGTDPGRFVPTYMIYSAMFRPDIYLITQNALADDTYMSVERDLYGDEIWIPAKEDSAEAFNIYVDEVKSGKREANGDLRIENGRVQVTGALGVMEINGILTKMMHDHDKYRHSFYIEESYVIKWMYPYLSPHGLIMKLNADKTPYDEQTAIRDQDFWDWYARRLTDDPMYRRDFAAQKSFSKLRAALAGLYGYQGRHREAAQTFREAVLLYPASPEASFRYARECLLPMRKFDIATELMDYTDKIDPNNQRTGHFRNYLGMILSELFKQKKGNEK